MTLGKLFTHMCICSPSSINWYRPVGGDDVHGCEGNRRSGVALSMRHRLSGIYGLNGLGKKDEHPGVLRHLYTVNGE